MTMATPIFLLCVWNFFCTRKEEAYFIKKLSNISYRVDVNTVGMVSMLILICSIMCPSLP